jgi:hypothetical protein
MNVVCLVCRLVKFKIKFLGFGLQGTLNDEKDKKIEVETPLTENHLRRKPEKPAEKGVFYWGFEVNRRGFIIGCITGRFKTPVRLSTLGV